MDLGHERRRLLVADQDVANGGPGERIGEVDVLLPGNAEHTGDSLVLEALDEEFSGTPSSFSHSRSVLSRGAEKSDRKAPHPRYRRCRCAMDRDALAAMPEAGPVPGSEAATTAKAGSSFRALRSRPFRLYFGGQVVSASGSFLQQTAIGWLVLELTGSPSDLGLVLAAGGIPSLLFGPWGGAVADRVDLRKLLARHPDALLPPGRAVVGAGRSGRGQRGGLGGHRRGGGCRPDRRLARPPGPRQPPGAAGRPGQRGQPQRGGGQQRPGGRPGPGRRADRDGGHDGVLRAQRVVLPGRDRRPARHPAPQGGRTRRRPDAEVSKKGCGTRPVASSSGSLFS